MGHLAVAKTIHVIVLSLYRIVDQAFIPLFLKSYTMNNRERLLRELKLSMKASGLLANLAFAGFVAMGRAYYRLWIPGQDIEAIYRLTVITLLTCIPTGAVHPLYYIYTLTVKKRFPCIVTVAGGLFNVAGMYILIRYGQMGVSAVVWTTAAVMMVIDFITNPLYMAHVLNLPLLTFYPGIIRNVLSCLVLLMVFQGLSCLYTPPFVAWVSGLHSSQWGNRYNPASGRCMRTQGAKRAERGEGDRCISLLRLFGHWQLFLLSIPI